MLLGITPGLIFFGSTGVKASRPVDPWSFECRNDMYTAICQGSPLPILYHGQTMGNYSECTGGSLSLLFIARFFGLETAQCTCLQFCKGQLSIC